MSTTAKSHRLELCLTLWLLVVLATAPASAVAGDQLPAYTLEEVAAHDNLASCWMAIDGKVYDVTAHVAIHPTEPDVIAAWCGREATEAMHTQGGAGAKHSDAAWGLLELYRVGTLTTD